LKAKINASTPPLHHLKGQYFREGLIIINETFNFLSFWQTNLTRSSGIEVASLPQLP